MGGKGLIQQNDLMSLLPKEGQGSCHSVEEPGRSLSASTNRVVLILSNK